MQGRPVNFLGATLAALFVCSGCASAPTEETPELAARVESAHSAQDHEAIAREYDRLSAVALASAAQHRRLATVYNSRYTGTTGEGLAAHCARLSNQHEAMAELYATMAAEHRDIGSHVGH